MSTIGPSVGPDKKQRKKNHMKIKIIVWYFYIARITVSKYARIKKYSYVLKQMGDYFYTFGTSKASV